MTRPVDLLLHARWIVPVEPAGQLLEDHTLVVHDGRIVALEPTDEARWRYTARESRRLDRHALLPGLVNAHTHTAMTLFRGLADDRNMMEWLRHHIWPAEARWVGPEFVRDGTRLALAEMIRGGVTCFNDMYFFPDVTAEVASGAGMRACVGLVVLEAPTAWAADADEYLARGREVGGTVASLDTVTAAWAPHAPYTVSDRTFERVRLEADTMDLPIHVHLHETDGEVRDAVARHGERPLARMERLGLLSPRLVAAHMIHLTDVEIDAVAAAGVHVAHCPEANLKLAAGFCPVDRLHRAGVEVALGTDGAASNNDLDLFGEMRTAALLAKGVAGDATAVPAVRALEMATLAGARALGLDDRIGSLVPGKAADVVAVDLGGPESHPLHDVVSQLVYTSGRERVTDVWVAGRPLLESRRLTSLDEDSIVSAAREWRERMA